MNKFAASLVFGIGLLLAVPPADGFVPRPTAEPPTSAPVTAGAVIAKKAKAPKKAADKKGDKAEGAGEGDSANKKPFPSKTESRKDIDDILKK